MLETMANGDIVLETMANGDVVLETMANGDIVMETMANGWKKEDCVLFECFVSNMS